MERNRIFGVEEPITLRTLNGKEDAMLALKLIDAVGFTAAREWIHIPNILKDPITPKQEAVELFTKVLNRYQELDIEIKCKIYSV